MVKNPDSIDKIVTVYLAATCIEPFEYKRKEYTPRTLILSPLIFREFICFERCGACCPLFSLDFRNYSLFFNLFIIKFSLHYVKQGD